LWQHSITRQTRWDIHLDKENILNRLKNPQFGYKNFLLMVGMSERILGVPNCLSRGKNHEHKVHKSELEERAKALQPIRYPTKFLSPNANKPGRNFEAITKPVSSIFCKRSVKKLHLAIKALKRFNYAFL